ncbi:MAG: hypothetical protein A2612_03635 [Candidatus Moranbacteria bacterium RIFOXYD1_FULL_44_12]|nr:MAG: hypothetical protein A2612_03635 [Candidatus Moranbacteria bacterium RIFOXYD1_FULL_44_12]
MNISVLAAKPELIGDQASKGYKNITGQKACLLIFSWAIFAKNQAVATVKITANNLGNQRVPGAIISPNK